MRTFRIQESIAGNVFETGLSESDAKERVAEFEQEDKHDGSFTEGFYEIVEEKFTVTETKTGLVLGTDLNHNEAELFVYQMEYTDKKNGVYVEDKYKTTENK